MLIFLPNAFLVILNNTRIYCSTLIKYNYDIIIIFFPNNSELRSTLLGGFPPDSCKDKETEKALYNKYGIKYDDNGRAIYYGAP